MQIRFNNDHHNLFALQLQTGIRFGEKIYPPKGITREQIDKNSLFHPAAREGFHREHQHYPEASHPLPKGNEQSHFVDKETEQYYLESLKDRGITPVIPDVSTTDDKQAACTHPVCNGKEHPEGHENCTHHEFESYTHDVYHWVKEKTEWLLPDNWHLDWVGEHAGNMASGIADPMTLGITGASVLASAATLYCFSFFQNGFNKTEDANKLPITLKA